MIRWIRSLLLLTAAVNCLAAGGCGRSGPLQPAPAQLAGVQGEVLRDASGAPSGIRVTWPRVDDPNVIGYLLYRDKSPIPDSARGNPDYLVSDGGNPVVPQPVGTATVQKDDLFPAAIGTTYYYRVTAVDVGYDESRLSPEASVLITLFNIISLLTPFAGVGDGITITGENLGVYSAIDDGVGFPGVAWEDGTGFVGATHKGTVTDWQADRIDANVPMGATTGQLPVTVDDIVKNTPEVFTNSDPYLTAISLLEASPSTVITLTGNNFGAAFDATHRVVIGDVELIDPRDYDSYSNTAIAFIVPNLPFVTHTVTVRVDNTNSNQAFLDVVPSPGPLWEHTWGADGAEAAEAVATDAVDDVYLAGGTASITFTLEPLDVLLVKYDAGGFWQWACTWNNSDNLPGLQDEAVADICYDGLDDQLLMTGNVQDTDGTLSTLLIAYDTAGNWQYTRKWVATGTVCWGRAIACQGPGVFIAGTVTNADDDVLLLRYDSFGNFVSALAWPLARTQEVSDIVIDGNGDLIIVGTTPEAFPGSGNDVFVLKVTGDFSLLWARYWGGPANDYAMAVTVDSSNNVYVTGGTGSFSAVIEPFIIKYDIDGNLQDENYWPRGVWHSYFTSININANGRFFCSGCRLLGTSDVFYAHLDTDYSTLSLLVYADAVAQPGGMDSLLDSAGNLLLCGDAISLGAAWADFTIQPLTAAGSTATETQATVEALGVSGNITGVSTNVMGTTDTGGGVNDMLIIKYKPDEPVSP